MKTKIIAIDQSTSATKAMLFNDACELLYRVNIPHHQIYPHVRGEKRNVSICGRLEND